MIRYYGCVPDDEDSRDHKFATPSPDDLVLTDAHDLTRMFPPVMDQGPYGSCTAHAGGPVATLLIALGFPPVQVSEWIAIGLAIVGVAAVAVPGFIGALKRTDSNKIADAAALPDVTKIVVKDTATDGVAKAMQDPAQPKVVPQSAA